VQRTLLSKQRNKHLQTTLIEAAKMAPRYSPTLAMLYDRENQKGNPNRATLAVARKLVAYLMAVGSWAVPFLGGRQRGTHGRLDRAGDQWDLFSEWPARSRR
jgi:transposase